MIVYLDQNKWIELARIVNGKDGSDRAKRLAKEFEAITNSETVRFPLSAIHYMETARIKDAARRSRLGFVMWRLSNRVTIANYPRIARHEVEVALSKHFPNISLTEFSLLGKGIAHAFELPPPQGLLARIPEEELDRIFLVGDKRLGIEPPYFQNSIHRDNFRNHLGTLHARANEVPKHLRDNWLNAIVLIDIGEPLYEAIRRYKLPENTLELLGESKLKQLVKDMPTRHLDLHLHRQVLRNLEYRTRETDLEDWSGLVTAACYCDVVVCEKHMASMLKRDGFCTKARIETDLGRVFVSLNDRAV